MKEPIKGKESNNQYSKLSMNGIDEEAAGN